MCRSMSICGHVYTYVLYATVWAQLFSSGHLLFKVREWRSVWILTLPLPPSFTLPGQPGGSVAQRYSAGPQDKGWAWVVDCVLWAHCEFASFFSKCCLCVQGRTSLCDIALFLWSPNGLLTKRFQTINPVRPVEVKHLCPLLKRVKHGLDHIDRLKTDSF